MYLRDHFLCFVLIWSGLPKLFGTDRRRRPLDLPPENALSHLSLPSRFGGRSLGVNERFTTGGRGPPGECVWGSYLFIPKDKGDGAMRGGPGGCLLFNTSPSSLHCRSIHPLPRAPFASRALISLGTHKFHLHQ
jgi:hypothetical protein